MSDEMKTFELVLCNGSLFRYSGPQEFQQAPGPVYFGTIGDNPSKSNELIDQLMELTLREPNCWGGSESEVTSLVTGSSPWTLLQFIDARIDWIEENLSNIIKDARQPMQTKE